MNKIGVEVWIMHGTLLGWWWNRAILPWDTDLDVQMSEESLQFVAASYNMTIHLFRVPGYDRGREYMMDVNPHYVNGSTADRPNVIDARWIDIQTGLFIDITALRYDTVAEDLGYSDRMICKDNHRYLRNEIYPLRDSTLENVAVKVPFSYATLLEREYGKDSLVQKRYNYYKFEEDQSSWVRTS